MTDSELSAARLWVAKHGPTNCWTGQWGEAAILMRLLLDEVERLREQLKREDG